MRFISVGALCQGLTRVFCVSVERVVLLMLRLKCLAKRKEALRGRNLSRDSQVKGAPKACIGPLGVCVTPEAVFCTLWTPVPCLRKSTVEATAGVNVSCFALHRLGTVITRLSLAVCGIELPVQRRRSGAAWRLDSSLRSHRTQRAQCRCVSSGLNKTLFASVGPNSHGRSRRQAASRFRECFTRETGWMKASRGLRLDGTPSTERAPWPQGVTMMPRNAISSISSGELLSWFAGHAGAVGRSVMFGGRSADERFLVADHGIESSQQASAHGHVGLGFADPADQSLADGLLFFVGAAERQGGLAQRPAQACASRPW